MGRWGLWGRQAQSLLGKKLGQATKVKEHREFSLESEEWPCPPLGRSLLVPSHYTMMLKHKETISEAPYSSKRAIHIPFNSNPGLQKHRGWAFQKRGTKLWFPLEASPAPRGRDASRRVPSHYSCQRPHTVSTVEITEINKGLWLLGLGKSEQSSEREPSPHPR